MEFRSYASSSAGNLYTVSNGVSRLLIEAGLSASAMRRAIGGGLVGFDACLLTHEHGDHAQGVESLISAGIDVYCSVGTAGALGIAGHRVKQVRRTEMFDAGTFTVMAFDTVHDCAEPLGFLIRCNITGEKLLFATDTQYLKYKFPTITHLAIEANFSEARIQDLPAHKRDRLVQSHMSIENVLKMIEANQWRSLQEIHLMHLSDANSDAAEFKRLVQTATGVPVYVCEK